MVRITIAVLVAFVVFALGCIALQRKLLYYPTHHHEKNGLTEWRDHGQLIGYVREVSSPKNIWLMLHGNGGQASDRAYALPSFSPRDSVYILEYPGYGLRPGSPSRSSFNAAAEKAYAALRSRFPHVPVCVVAESIGSGPAAFLAQNRQQPDKIVLIVPFDILSRVAARHYPFLPTKLFLLDNWNNIEALKGYRGHLEIFAARDDIIIPMVHAQSLAERFPNAKFHEIPGGHNDWAVTGQVRIANP